MAPVTDRYAQTVDILHKNVEGETVAGWRALFEAPGQFSLDPVPLFCNEGESRMPYSKDELVRMNGPYCSEHLLTQADIDTVNTVCARIEALQQGDPVPRDGDRIICIGPTKGITSKRGYLERRENIVSVCVDPYTPFIDAQSLATSACGGPWSDFREEQFLARAEYAGKTLANLKVWGHFGQSAHGAIYFQAHVSLWRLTDPLFD